jgi:hypothetical protein
MDFDVLSMLFLEEFLSDWQKKGRNEQNQRREIATFRLRVRVNVQGAAGET